MHPVRTDGIWESRLFCKFPSLHIHQLVRYEFHNFNPACFTKLSTWHARGVSLFSKDSLFNTNRTHVLEGILFLRKQIDMILSCRYDAKLLSVNKQKECFCFTELHLVEQVGAYQSRRSIFAHISVSCCKHEKQRQLLIFFLCLYLFFSFKYCKLYYIYA